MAAELIDGKQIAADVREQVRAQVSERVAAGARAPSLATVLVGDDAASQVYVRNKHRACEEAGISSVNHELPAEAAEEQLLELIGALGADPGIDGILVQLPLPAAIDTDRVIAAIPPGKDVDGLTPANLGRLAAGSRGLVPCTPAGVIELLDATRVEIAGSEAVVIGRSNLVGRPLALLLLGRDATVTVGHSRTRDLVAVCRRAEILVAAAGVPGLIGPEMVAPGATVIDVGINRTDDGLVGDVQLEPVREVAGAVTPVPGGVGPMTIALLLRNTLAAAGASA